MNEPVNVANEKVTKFLDDLNHPFRSEIERLRALILGTEVGLSENIKWNGPNYSFGEEDRITMKILPPKVIQLIFHRGAKVKEQPGDRLISDQSGMLAWRENDRAIATFKTMQDVENRESDLIGVVKDWIAATTV
ncbi:DUF1801 domain-containing protein [Dyadobacter sp. CY323]|uniref:DUF1801 domain-containing protein n=1 Tax=Dyadobacter sp. CY323 TaxID=2907302 RepID=UPI001F43D362|nr:DUF1801 domain-containing protein [Dyadobacter sp. CY323]MCE6992666.1 DUF1801 domain-containing protein [Dyadobacter sp. CY323]